MDLNPFLNDYHAAMKKADPDGTMKESKKKFYLLHAIKKDTRYAYTADACDNESLLKTITKLRIKAQELKDLGHSSNRNHNNTSTTTRSNKKKWNRNYKSQGGGNKTQHNSGSSGNTSSTNTATNRLPSSLFNKASPEEKRLIIQLQNKARSNNNNTNNQYPKGESNKKVGSTGTGNNSKDDKAPARKVNVTQQAQAQDTSTYSGIFSPARKMNFSKSKRDKTSTASKEKEWDIEVPVPYSANRDLAFKEKLGEIILAFNKPAFDKYGDILQDSSLMNCDVNPTKQRSFLCTTNSTTPKPINLSKKSSISTALKPLFGSLSMNKGEYYVTMFLPNDESELKYQESTCTLSYAAVNYTEQLVDWAIQHKLYDQPLWAWTQQHIKMVDKAAPVKSRKGRIQRITKKVPIWNHVNVPREMIDPRKQFIQNHAHLATKMGTSDIIKASTVTIPQTWNRTKYDVKPTVRGHKGVTIKTKKRMKEFAAKQKPRSPRRSSSRRKKS